ACHQDHTDPSERRSVRKDGGRRDQRIAVTQTIDLTAGQNAPPVVVVLIPAGFGRQRYAVRDIGRCEGDNGLHGESQEARTHRTKAVSESCSGVWTAALDGALLVR